MMLVALESRSGWLVVWGWQVSQRPLAACKGEWEDKYLSWVMAWRSVPVSGLRFNAQMEVLNRLFSLSFPFTCVMCCSIMLPVSCAAQSCYLCHVLLNHATVVCQLLLWLYMHSACVCIVTHTGRHTCPEPCTCSLELLQCSHHVCVCVQFASTVIPLDQPHCQLTSIPWPQTDTILCITHTNSSSLISQTHVSIQTHSLSVSSTTSDNHICHNPKHNHSNTTATMFPEWLCPMSSGNNSEHSSSPTQTLVTIYYRFNHYNDLLHPQIMLGHCQHNYEHRLTLPSS